MPRPNVLTYKGSGILQILNNSEFNEVTEVVLEKFAAVDGPGNIYNQQDANNAYVSIGTFTDTRFQGAIGSGDITILSTQYNLYQDVTNNWVSVPNPPLHWDGYIKESTGQDLNDIADEMINYMVSSEGPGSYQLAQSTPVGGTWTSIGSIDNINDTGSTTTYNLYKKIGGTTTLTYSLLKHVSGGTIQLMTTAELEQLVEKVRERIVTTGIGTYVFQESAPVVGTWVNKGTIIDTRPTTQAQNYEGPAYTSDVAYQGEEEIQYVGVGPVIYDIDYVGTYEISYDGTTGGTFNGPGPPLSYDGAEYFGSYDSASYLADYLGPDLNYTADAGSPGGGTEAYIADLPVSYVSETGIVYVGPGDIGYTGEQIYLGLYIQSYELSYELGYLGPAAYTGIGGPDVNYEELYLGLTTFQLDYVGAGAPDGANYSSLPFDPQTIFDGPLAYFGTIANAIVYLGEYVGPGAVNTVTYQRDFSGPALTYLGDYLGPGISPDYQGNYLGAATYVGNYIGPAGPGVTYVGDYGGPGVQYTADYLGPGPDITYGGDYLGPSGPDSAAYTLSYVGPPAEVAYSGPGVSNYAGPSFVDLPYIIEYTGPGFINYDGEEAYEGAAFDSGTLYVISYTSDNYFGPGGSASYDALIPDGIAYTIDVPVDYVGTGITYINDYVATYDTSYLASFTGPGPTTAYDGVTPESYLTDYEGPQYITSYTGVGPDAANYSGLVPANYAGAVDYSSTYGGSIINNDSTTITTRTLWRRIG